MTAGLLYTKCALRCQEWMTFFILLHEISQISPGPSYVCVLPHHKRANFSGSLLVNQKLGKLWKYWTETFPAVQGLFADWQFSQSPGAQKQKMRNQSAASALDWVEKKKKRFSTGAKNNNVFIAKRVFLSASSPCANENSPVIKTPVSSAHRIATLAGFSLLSDFETFSQREMWCEMKSNVPIHALSKDEAFWW